MLQRCDRIDQKAHLAAGVSAQPEGDETGWPRRLQVQTAHEDQLLTGSAEAFLSPTAQESGGHCFAIMVA